MSTRESVLISHGLCFFSQKYMCALHIYLHIINEIVNSIVFQQHIDITRYIYMKESGSHKWQNLMVKENLKIPGFHFYGTMKLFTKVVWLYCAKVFSFPDLKTSPCLVHTHVFGHVTVYVFFRAFAAEILFHLV